MPFPEAVKAIRLSGEVRWEGGKRVSKGTQSWKLLDVAPMAAPRRDPSRPLAERTRALLAARPAFERGSGGLVEEPEHRMEAGEKSTPAAVLRVLADQLFTQYDDTGDEGVVVDRGSPAPFRLRLVHDGGRPGPGFTLLPDWSAYE